MKKSLLISLLFLPILAMGQVVTFPKTLPQNSFSAGAAANYNSDVFAFDGDGPSFMLHGGYGIQYSLDVNLKYIYYVYGKDYIGVDMQYLFYETRKSYFSVITGLHMWNDFGFDLSGVYTYSMRYWLNFSVGLDMDLSFAEDVSPRFWVPLNAGFNVSEELFMYLEFNFPVSERAWTMVSLGANYVFR